MIVPKGVTLYANGKRYKSGKDMPKGFDEKKVEEKGIKYAKAQPKSKAEKKVKRPEQPKDGEV